MLNSHFVSQSNDADITNRQDSLFTEMHQNSYIECPGIIQTPFG